MFVKRLLPLVRDVLNRNLLTNTVERRAFSSTVSGDISVLRTNEPKTLAESILTQSDIREPLALNVKPLDLSNVNTNITPIREVWVENMSTPNSIKLAILPLHPSIFSAFPRPDTIQSNHRWQTMYKYVDYTCMPTRAEIEGSTKKPWPQKRLGKARHSSRKAPMWKNGGWATGPRGPRSHFYLLPWTTRVNGLISMLASKHSQNDMFVVDSFNGFPIDGTANQIHELCETRSWGPSVLFVDKLDLDEAPKYEHFCRALDSIPHMNFMPVYSLNVFSMLKHETLVLTSAALEDIQEKLLFQLKRIDLRNVIFKCKPDGVYRM